MDEIFIKIFNMSLVSLWLILAVIILRLFLKKSPKWIRCVLWAMVAVRLIVPFSFESGFSWTIVNKVDRKSKDWIVDCDCEVR